MLKKLRLKLRNMRLNRKLQVLRLNMMLKQPVLLQKVKRKPKRSRQKVLLKLKQWKRKLKPTRSTTELLWQR